MAGYVGFCCYIVTQYHFSYILTSRPKTSFHKSYIPLADLCGDDQLERRTWWSFTRITRGERKLAWLGLTNEQRKDLQTRVNTSADPVTVQKKKCSQTPQFPSGWTSYEVPMKDYNCDPPTVQTCQLKTGRGLHVHNITNTERVRLRAVWCCPLNQT
jgi:hypothetical protein